MKLKRIIKKIGMMLKNTMMILMMGTTIMMNQMWLKI